LREIPFTEKLDYFLTYLTTITKEDADFIEHICKLSDEDRQAFIMAKKMFEEEK
jgi:hypothetical protein